MKGFGAAAASAAAMMLCGGGAYAADLGTMPVKALPVAGPAVCSSIMDFFTTACQLSAYGVRVYGTIDIGGNYMTNGSPFDKMSGAGINYFPTKNSFGGRWNIAPSGLSASNVGVQIKEPLGAGWSFVAQLETGFNPYSGNVANGVGSVHENIGVPMALQTAYGDSNSQGKFFNNLGFAGVSNDTWGTLTFGRQNTLMADAILAYDPFSSSLAFSPLGFFGAWGGGGDTEDRKGTTSVKYRVSVANWHFGAFAQLGGYEEGNAEKGAYQGNIGADFKVGPGTLSADVEGGYTKDAVGVTIVSQTNPLGYPVNTFTAAVGANPFGNAFESATLSNNVNVMLSAKYTVDRLKVFAGYEWIQYTDPSDPYTVPGTGFNTVADNFLCFNCTALNGTQINSTAFIDGNKISQIFWFGGQYAITDSLDVIAAGYHVTQNDFSGGTFNTPAKGTGAALTCAQSSTSSFKCAGSQDTASVVFDWRFAPKWDTYIGTMYTTANGGMDNGFLARNNWSTTGGVRFRW
jgi:predicted porin